MLLEPLPFRDPARLVVMWETNARQPGVLSLALSRTLTSLLYDTAGTDPLTFTVVVGILGASRSPQATSRAARGAHSPG